MIADVTIYLSNDTIQGLMWIFGFVSGATIGALCENEVRRTQTLWHKVKVKS